MAVPVRPENIGRERLLGLADVREILGCGYAVASAVMKESGCCLRIHSRLYVLESSFFGYLHSLEGKDPGEKSPAATGE